MRVPAAIPRLRIEPPARGFAGYPFVVRVRVRELEDGAPVVVERSAGGRWRSLGAGAVTAGRAAVLVRGLPAGAARLRARVPAGSFTVTSRGRSVVVRPPGLWRTRGLAGRYAGPRGLRFSVARGGRTLERLRGRVRSVCSGVSGAVRVAEVRLAHARIDPAGRFAGAGEVGGGTRIGVRGRLLPAAGGRVRLAVVAGGCGGITRVFASRTSTPAG